MFWTPDLGIDCDGTMSAVCSSATDPAYQNDTALHDSMDLPLDAAALPYVVVPGISARFDCVAAGLELGTVIAAIHGDELEYGVFGPRTISTRALLSTP
jgi:glycosyl hydrolase group 75 (putative chitosanase)